MMNFQDKLQTTAPSIRYEGDIRPEQAQLRQQQAQAMMQMQQQPMMQQPQGMMQPQIPQPQMPQPQMPQPQMPQPQGRMPAMAMGGIAGLNMPGYNSGGTVGSMRDRLKSKGYDWIDDADDDTVRQIFDSEEGTFSIPSRSSKAYGGIMGDDGRRQYGIGSWFQEKIMDPIKNNPVTSAVVGGALLNQFGIPFTGNATDGRMGQNFIGNLLGGRDAVLGAGGGDGEKLINLGEIMKARDSSKPDAKTPFGLSTGMLSTIGGGVAGLFSDRLNQSEDAEADRGVGIGIQNIGQAANILDPKQGQAAGLRFLPELSTRKYSPAEMLVEYGATNKPLATANLADGGSPFQMDMPNYEQNVINPNMMEEIKILVQGLQNQGLGMEEIKEKIMMEVPNMTMGFAEGGGIGDMMEEESEMIDMGGMEKDYREEGGFVPIGEYEKKDDVPARLSVNEFVFTADAVRGAGDGDIDKGAERLQGIMKELEKQGKPEGMEMMEVSERLSEVV